MMVPKSLTGLLVFAVALLVGICPHFDSSSANEPQRAIEKANKAPIKIGLLLCLTGACAETGNNARRGVELAVEQVNAAGGLLGRQLELIVQDSREMEGGGSSVAGYRQLRRDPDIHAIIGPTWTVGGLPLAPIIPKEKDVVVISPSLGVAEFNEAAPHIFNTWPHDSVSTESLARYALRRGWKNAAIFSNQNPWESTQAKTFESAYQNGGGRVVAFEEPTSDTRDLRVEAARIKAKGPDVVFMSNYSQMDIAARTLRGLGYRGEIMTILMDETRIASANGALEGALFARYKEPSASFAESYLRRWKEPHGIGSDTGFDALKAFALAAETSKSLEADDVSQAMLRLVFDGATGEVRFDSKGGVLKTAQLWVVRKGRQSYVEELLDE